MRSKWSVLALLAALAMVLVFAAPSSADCDEGESDANYCEGPLVTTGAASNVTDTSATLNGTVNPRGEETTYFFQIGTTPEYGTSVPISQDAPAGAGNEPMTVEQSVTGLTPSTTYHYRIVARNEDGTSRGVNRTFTTSNDGTPQPKAPIVLTGDARNIGENGAEITGAIIPGDRPVAFAFAYGLTTAYGQRTPIRTLPANNSGVAVAEAISNLAPGTTYHYQLVAINDQNQTAFGGDRTFTTAPLSGKQRPQRVSSSVRPKRDETRPYRYVVRGTITLPATFSGVGARAAQVNPCSGRVRIVVKQGRRTRGRTVAPVRSNCRYTKRVTAKRVRGTRGRLKVRAKFRGNSQLKARRAPTKRVFFGPRR